MSKIAFIGAGSVVFTKTLVCDVLQNPALQDSTIALMDIDPRRLETAATLVKRIVAQMGVKARVEATLDLKKACKGARYAITTIQVGGYKPSTVVDFEIPKKYGLRQTIADTLGVGGVFRALRTIPKLIDVARALQDHGAPNALLLNYTNPMAMNMWAIDRAVGLPSVGLCHSVQGTSRQMAAWAGAPWEEVSYICAGINHMAFFLKFEYQGKDLYPLLFKKLEEPGFAEERVRFEMMRRLGYFVTESSEHHSEYCPYFIHHGQEMIDRFRIPLDEYIRRCESIIATWERTERDMLADPKPLKISRSVEYGSQIINSCESGQPSVIYGNVRNRGLIDNLPAHCCVEVPCLVDRQGLQPTIVGALPPQLAAYIRTNVGVQELTVEAALTGRREHIYHAVMLDPHTSATLPLDKIWAMCDELIEAHQRDGMLGAFDPVQPGTGRSRASCLRVYASVQAKRVDRFGNGDFELILRNETESDYTGSIEVTASHDEAVLSLPATVKAKIPVGSEQRWPFTVQWRQQSQAGARLRLTSLDPRLLAIDYPLPHHDVLKAPLAGPPLALRLDWMQENVLTGTIATTPEAISFRFRVRDTDPRPMPDQWWTSSVLEFFFCPLGGTAKQIVQLVALPFTGGVQVRQPSGQEVPGIQTRLAADPGGYDFEMEVPWTAAGLPGPNTFVFELIAGVNALGDAHGGVRVVWKGSHAPHQNMSRAACLEITA